MSLQQHGDPPGSWTAHSESSALDDPATTIARRDILQHKRFLRRIYEEWYQEIARSVVPGEGQVL